MSNNKYLYLYSRGFALVEVAIALVIISISLGGLFALMKVLKVQQQTEVSMQNEKVIIAALNRFYHLNGYLPCPSRTNSNIGEALTQCHGASQQIGILPFKTLGVSNQAAKNSFGFYFTYAVSEVVTIAPGALTAPATANNLEILDVNSRPYLSLGSCFAFILLNHGKNGQGAFSLKSERDRFSASNPFENENASDTLRFYVGQNLPNHTGRFIVQHDLHPPIQAPAATTPPVEQADDDLLDDPYADM